MNSINEILEFFPYVVRQKILEFDKSLNSLEEIHIRTNRNILLKIGQDEYKVDYLISSKEVLDILQKICDNSIYTYQSQICNGFITIKGGHRVGITGNVVYKDGQVINISHIYSLNFRIARQILGCSNELLKYILNIKENTIYNTIILSPPGRGKTTIIRDAVRNLSNGIKEIRFKGINVGVVDERGEIAAMYKGIPQNDLGERTDILDNVSKDIGMKMLIRSMNPRVIVADEIGTKEDIDAINYAVCSGVNGLFTAHGSSLNDISLNPILKTLLELKTIQKVILIEKNRSLQLIYSQ